MSKLWLRLLILFNWVVGRGPWLVVGHYVDDEGKQRRFATTPLAAPWHNLDDASDYCELRNMAALTDPLGTAYYVWHELEFKHFWCKEKC